MTLTKLSRFGALLAGFFLAGLMPIQAFPPAPNHLIFGVVRDQIGNPLDVTGARIVLETTAGVQVVGPIIPQLEPGVNYRLEIPMDAGLSGGLYQPTALLPAAPFRLKVRIGETTYLPMEMKGSLSNLGLPGGRSRVDLTLGVDADGNGLPDDWENAAANFLGLRWAAGMIKPSDQYPGTGLTYRDVYLAGTYAIDPEDGFSLKIIPASGEGPKLAFTAVKGRAYMIQAGTELGKWSAVPFRVLPLNADSPKTESYQATVTQRVEIEAPGDAANGPARFYRLIVR